MQISSKRLYLREANDLDIFFLRDLERNIQVIQYNSDSIPSVEQVDNKYLGIQKWTDEKPRHRFCFVAIQCDTNKPIGKVTLKLLNDSINEWEIGWAFHPDYWGNGYASEASRAVVEYAFSHLNAHRITAFCNAENVKSEKVMLRIGMKRDGCLRETIKLNGLWKNEFVYSILQSDIM